MKRIVALIVALAMVWLMSVATAEAGVPEKYQTLIDLLEAGSVEAAKLEFDRLVSEITGAKSAPTDGFVPVGIGDSIEMESFSIGLEALHVIDGQDVPFDTNTIGGPQLCTDYPDEGAHRVYITGPITKSDDAFELRNHVYGRLILGDEVFENMETYDSDGRFFFGILVPSDIVPYLDGAVMQVFLKDALRYGDYVYEDNFDVAYEISLAQ